MSGHNVNKVLVRKILDDGARWPWEVQGLGMLRLRLGREIRLHIWHEGLIYDNKPSQIHNHPWDFTSHIVAGTLRNNRYVKAAFGPPNLNVGTIVCGMGGSCEPEQVEAKRLILYAESVYEAGASYSMLAEEFHTTTFQNGTTTIIERKFREDTERAQVAFPLNGKWESAEPRRATRAEIELAINAALELF